MLSYHSMADHLLIKFVVAYVELSVHEPAQAVMSTNIRIKLPLNIIRIRIRAISGVQIYLNICLVNMRHPNIFGYLFGT